MLFTKPDILVISACGPLGKVQWKGKTRIYILCTRLTRRIKVVSVIRVSIGTLLRTIRTFPGNQIHVTPKQMLPQTLPPCDMRIFLIQAD